MLFLFGEIVTTPAVLYELEAGRENGVDVPDIASLSWVTIQTPQASKAIPLVSDLGDGETEVGSV